MWFTKAEMLLWPFNPLLGFTGSSSTRWTSWTESKVREHSKTAAHQHNERRKPFITEEHSRSWRQASRRGEKNVTEKVPYQKIYPLSQKTLLREKVEGEKMRVAIIRFMGLLQVRSVSE